MRGWVVQPLKVPKNGGSTAVKVDQQEPINYIKHIRPNKKTHRRCLNHLHVCTFLFNYKDASIQGINIYRYQHVQDPKHNPTAHSNICKTNKTTYN